MALTPEEIVPIFRAFHNREPSPEAVAAWQAQAKDVEALVRGLRDVMESVRKAAEPGDYSKSEEYLDHSARRFGVPRELQVTPTPLKRVLLVGNCLLAPWPQELKALGVTVDIDHVLIGPNEPPAPPRPAEDYSFQVTAIGNRHILNDFEMLVWTRMRHDDVRQADALLATCRGRVERMLELGAALRDKIPTFVTPFLAPQQDLNGRLIDPRGSGAISGLYEGINAHLRQVVARMDNVYVLDTIRIFDMIGRRHLQDDVINISTHAALNGDGFVAEDSRRIAPARRPSAHYDWKVDDFLFATWLEAEAMYRTLRQIDQVKMVCVDLDDTLWRGVLAEAAEIEDIDVHSAVEGWPTGLVEALLVLKRRGVLLCLVSKNAQERVRAIFAKVYRNRIALEDFAILKINWAPKPENIRQAMEEANLLPRSVVFLDDSPAERAAVKQAFPEIRVIEAPHYYWRRILLWSAETQTAAITDESARRTEMVQAQVKRESARAQTDRQDFLADLELKVEIAALGKDGKRFTRALELVNKSNQFNTTGRRWSAQELAAVADAGGLIVAAVTDKYADYGDTFVALVSGERIEQVVMSCRVITLGVELAALSAIARSALARHRCLVAEIVETDANAIARDLYAKLGWNLQDGEWTTSAVADPPSHVTLVSKL